MAAQIVPLTTNPNQTFQISLAINGSITRLLLTIRYNEMANYWVMGIKDVNGNDLVDSIPLITGAWPAANLLEQFQYLRIGSAYIINLSNPNDYPNSASLGGDFQLLWDDNV